MNRFVGLSLMCLVFMSTQADPGEIESEFKGSSWSLYMSQNGDEPIQVQSERKEYDKNGMTVHKKSQGIIDRDGIYKPIDAQDFQIPDRERSFSEYNQKKDEEKFDRDEFFRSQHKVKPHKKHGGLWKVFAYPFVKDDGDNSQDKAFQEKRFHGFYPKFTGSDSKENDMEKKLSKRSRVSFYRPVEKMFERIFGPKRELEEKRKSLVKRPSFLGRPNQKQRVQWPQFEHEPERRSPFGFKHDQRMENPPFRHDQKPRMQSPMKSYPVKKAERKQPKRWFDDFERRQQATWERMRELEEFFFGDFYGERE